MPKKQPSILVTGASGIVGRNFLEAAKEEFFIYALARQSQHEAGVPEHPNIKWLQVDIGNLFPLKQVILNAIHGRGNGSIDFVLHLASYYDFNYTDHPEYQRTNVTGTRHVLELSRMLKVKRFIFASSVAASNFPGKGKKITEKSLVDADYAYARSKREGEKMVQEFSRLFPCSIVRLAAVITDWCEYGILYVFLSTWFSKKWRSRVLGGKGESAVPYIHSYDLNRLLLTIFRESNRLPRCDTYIASPNGSTSHRELFDMATRLYFGRRLKPLHLPKSIALPGVILRDIWGRLVGKRPFERPWMLKYLDLKLDIDASYTREALSWEPTPRFHILRRLLYLIEKMKTNPDEWHYKNTRALKRVPQRPNMLIYETMVKRKDGIIDEIKATLLAPERRKVFSHYQKINRDNFDWDVGVFYQLLTATVRNQDRALLMNYARDLLVNIRFNEGFQSPEVCAAILDTGKIVVSRLLKEPALKGMEELIYDYIILTIQLTVDEVENAFEKLSREKPSSRASRSDIEDKLKELATFCYQWENQDSPLAKP